MVEKKVWLIVVVDSDGDIWPSSHDWGGEFYYKKSEAKERAAELQEDIDDDEVAIVQATMSFSEESL